MSLLRNSSASDGIKTGDRTGVGFFIPLSPELASQFPDLGEQDQSSPHTTFLYVGEVTAEREDEFLAVTSKVFESIRGPVTGYLTDLDYFTQPQKEQRVALMRVRFSHDLAGLRWRLRDALLEAGFAVDDYFPLVYSPHVTLAYMPGLEAVYTEDPPKGTWDFEGIEIWGLPQLHTVKFGHATRTASRKVDAMHHVSIELMKFLSSVSRKLGVAEHIYVVGGAVRNFVINEPIKDIDVVVDSVALHGKDSEWFAQQLQHEIPVPTNLTTNNYGVAILTIKGDWEVAGKNLAGEVIEIANARTESYSDGGYKPDDVAPATIVEDTYRREFTFNTLLWRMHDLANGPDKAEILDLTGCGLSDLKDGVMRCPSDPDKTFTDDPSRMIRALKFLLKYKFKISPDVEASIKKNKEKLRNIPGGHLSNMIITLFYETGVGKRALLEMERLGMLDVVKSIAQSDKPFREALANWAERHADLEFLFDLMDLGMPVGRRLGFLTPPQKDRVREITVQMNVEDGAEFVLFLEQPGKVINMPGMIQEFGLKGAEIKLLMDTARTVLLDDPVLAASPHRLEDQIRDQLVRRGKTAAVQGDSADRLVSRYIEAKTFSINEGDPILFGKFKNKRGIIRGFGATDKGDPTVTVETNSGAMQVVQLFKIREDKGREPAPQVGGIVSEDKEALAGHTPEYARLTNQYTVMNRTADPTWFPHVGDVVTSIENGEGWSYLNFQSPTGRAGLDSLVGVPTDGRRSQGWKAASDMKYQVIKLHGRVTNYPMPQEPTDVYIWVGEGTPTQNMRFVNKVNVQIEDRGHDWNWTRGKFRYSGIGAHSAVPGGPGEDDFWLVIKYGTGPDREKTKECPSCGSPIPDHALFCPNCGGKQASLAAYVRLAATYQTRDKKAQRTEWTDRYMPSVGETYAWTTWGGGQYQGTVTDTDSNVLYVACTDGKTRVVEAAATYQKKKKVKTQDGEDMTVYEYSDKQIETRHKDKAKRIDSLRGKIDKLRAQYRKDLKADDDKVKYVALAVGLMDETYERVGNDESAKEGHFGVTGWQKKHISFSGSKAKITYVGKSGVDHVKEVTDSALVTALKSATKGKKDNDPLCEGEDCRIGAEDVNEYLKPFDVSAKDIRGFHANTEMQTRLKAVRSKGGKLPTDKKEKEKKLKDEFKQALDETAEAVGHEAATLRSQYLVPGLEDEFMKDGSVSESLVKTGMSRHASFPTVQEVFEAGNKGDHYRLTCPNCGGVTKCRCMAAVHEMYPPIVGFAACLTCSGAVREATKTPAEKEDDQAEAMIHSAPKSKPPRQDLRNHIIKEDDPDADKGADEDPDKSKNYKKVADLWLEALNKRQQKKDDKKKQTITPLPALPKLPKKKEEPEHKPGDVWKTEDGFAAKNPKGVTHAFAEEEAAKVYSQGGEAEESAEKPKEESPAKEDPSKKLTGLADALDNAKDKDIRSLTKELKEHFADNPEAAAQLDTHLKAFNKSTRDLALASLDMEKSVKTKHKEESQAKLDAAEKLRADALEGIRNLANPKKAPAKEDKPSEAPAKEEPPPEAKPKEAPAPDPAPDADTAMESFHDNPLIPEDMKERSRALLQNTPPEGVTAMKTLYEDEAKKLDADIAKSVSGSKADYTDWAEQAIKLYTEALGKGEVTYYHVVNAALAAHVLAPPAGEKTPAPAPAPTTAPAKTEEEDGDEDEDEDVGDEEDGKAKPAVPTPAKIPTGPVEVGGVAVTDDPKDSAQLKERSQKAFTEYSRMESKDREVAALHLQANLKTAVPGSPAQQEMESLTDGLQLASLVKGDKKPFPGRPPVSPQLATLAKALGKTNKAHLLLPGSDGFNSPQGRETIREALDTLNPSEVAAIHGAREGDPLHAALTNKDLSKGQQKILADFFNTLAVDSMTSSHSAMLAGFKPSDESAGGSSTKETPTTTEAPGASSTKRDLSTPEGVAKLDADTKDFVSKSPEYLEASQAAATCIEDAGEDPTKQEECQKTSFAKVRIVSLKLQMEYWKTQGWDPPADHPAVVQVEAAVSKGDPSELDAKFIHAGDEVTTRYVFGGANAPRVRLTWV